MEMKNKQYNYTDIWMMECGIRNAELGIKGRFAPIISVLKVCKIVLMYRHNRNTYNLLSYGYSLTFYAERIFNLHRTVDAI